MTRPRKQSEMVCGCRVAQRQIVFCAFHGKVQPMATLLDAVRRYFLQTTGEQSPFVQKIDALLPRREAAPQP